MMDKITLPKMINNFMWRKNLHFFFGSKPCLLNQPKDITDDLSLEGYSATLQKTMMRQLKSWDLKKMAKKIESASNRYMFEKQSYMTLNNFIFAATIILFSSCQTKVSQQQKESAPTLSGNPVIEGWYADPEAIVYNDRYWIYPTYSDAYSKQVFMDCFSSPDLVEWTKHERIIDTTAVTWADSAMWAPGVIENKGNYYLFFAANDVHEGQIGGIGVAMADKPEGPFKDIIGKPLINEIVNGAQPIDQFVFKDKDGTHYMYYGGWGHCNMVKLNDDFTALVPFDDGTLYKEVTPENYVEGPFMFIRNGKYYFMWSEGGWGGPNYKVAYAISDTPFGPFEREGVILEQNPEVATGAGHHSVIQFPNEDEYYIVYHRRPLEETHHNHRVTCIDKMEFDDDGKIKPVEITFEGVAARPLK